MARSKKENACLCRKSGGVGLGALLSVTVLFCASCRPGELAKIPGGVLAKGFSGIEYIDISTGRLTVLLPSRDQRYSAADYDLDSETLYYVDTQDKCVKRWRSGAAKPEIIHRMPKDCQADWPDTAWLLLNEDKTKLVISIEDSSRKGYMVLHDLQTGREKRVPIPARGVGVPFFWLDPSHLLMEVILPSDRAEAGLRTKQGWFGGYIATLHLGTGKVTKLFSSKGVDSFGLFPDRSRVVANRGNKRFVIHELPTGKVLKEIDAKDLPGGWQFFEISAVGDSHILKACGKGPHWPLGLYVFNLKTGKATRFTWFVMLGKKMRYIPRAPNWTKGR